MLAVCYRAEKVSFYIRTFLRFCGSAVVGSISGWIVGEMPVVLLEPHPLDANHRFKHREEKKTVLCNGAFKCCCVPSTSTSGL